MKNKSLICEICDKQCKLSKSDTDKVVEASKSLNVLSDFYGSDVFIDIPSINDDEAVVVAHVKPQNNKSLYKQSVVGQSALKGNEPGVFNTLESGIEVNDIKALTQENKFVSQKIRPIVNEDRVIGAIIVETDISDNVKRDIELGSIQKHSEIRTPEFINLLKSNKELTNNFDDGILIFDNNGVLSIANDKIYKMCEILGHSKDIENKTYDQLAFSKKKYSEIINDLNDDRLITEIKMANNYFKLISTVVGREEKNLLILIKDITEVKNKEKEIELKTIAVKEANHRIKNNLQTVAAILRKQSREFKNNNEKIDLDVCINRILTIAKTHDFLSKSISDRICLGKAIKELVENIKISNGMNNIINVDSDDISIAGEKATAILLIINELVQNSYEHAFEGRTSGTINITAKSKESNVTITVIDDGRGFDNSEKARSSLGLSLVNNYTVNVLQGNIDIDSSVNGTSVKIRFSNN